MFQFHGTSFRTRLLPMCKCKFFQRLPGNPGLSTSHFQARSTQSTDSYPTADCPCLLLNPAPASQGSSNTGGVFPVLVTSVALVQGQGSRENAGQTLGWRRQPGPEHHLEAGMSQWLLPTALQVHSHPALPQSTTILPNVRKGAIIQLRVVKLSMRKGLRTPSRTLNNYLPVRVLVQTRVPVFGTDPGQFHSHPLSKRPIRELHRKAGDWLQFTEDQTLSQQSTYLGSQQCLSIIITRHEDFHYCY